MSQLLNSHKRILKILLLCYAYAIGGSFIFASAVPKKQEPGLLFYLSGSQGFNADYSAGGNPEPNFLEKVKIIKDGARGQGFECDHKQLMSYWAPGNIYAERGTLSFFWRSREPVGKTEFPIFRVGYADHSSWDMVWLRIDYNGYGFDAFVTDVNLARVRVSTKVSSFPEPNEWIHLALSWDETVGIRFYINGKLAAQKDSVVVLSAGLDQFGPHSRIISPVQVQSAYNFQRGGDIDEIRIYDRMLSDDNISHLAKGESAGEVPELTRALNVPRWRDEWWLRYGWNRTGDVPPYLDKSTVKVRKVEIHDVFDLKRWWWKGTDGIRETTWPGVYNRSRLPGRDDYFQLPDWDCYSLSGKSVTFFMPDEPWNHIEISGAAWGNMSLLISDSDGEGTQEKKLFQRPRGQEKTVHRITETVVGEKIRFANFEQEMPIGELSAYYVDEGKEPDGICTLDYTLTGRTGFANDQVKSLLEYINNRYMSDERTVMMAIPGRTNQRPAKTSIEESLPIIHILIPYDPLVGIAGNVDLDSTYSWDKIDGGLDGIAVDLPAMDVIPTHGDFIPLNIQVKDPNWPMRNMLDFSFSVKPGEARTLWLDIRDRIFPDEKSLYLTIAGADHITTNLLEGMQIRLIFKPWKVAYREHVQDRFTQVRDNYANIIEERVNDPRLNLYNRFMADITDLLRISPEHYPGQNYWYDVDRNHRKPAFVQPVCPSGVPMWAFRQIENLRYFKRFVMWWIDNRQISNGELGGGLSDDDDLTNCWPGAALMGCEPEKIRDAVLRLLDTIYDQDMFTNGLSTIQTDGLHAHEEGIAAQTQAILVDYGSPKQLERIMETVRALDEKIMLKNKYGHRHFRSSYFSGTKIADESVWEWSLQPQQFLLLQPVLTLAEYNGNPRARQLAIDMADGLLAHARKDKDGKIIIDTEINFSSDSSRPSQLGFERRLATSMGEGAMFNTSTSGLQLLWAVYRMTGEKKYIQPLLDLEEIMLGSIANNGLDLLDKRADWGKRIVEKVSPTSGTDLFRHIAWQMTGNKAYLEYYYADQIEGSALREYINTEGSLWTDRVFAANRELQRSRLGGIALVRGAIYSGHVVSWKFISPASEESIAILIPESTPSAFKVIGYSLEKEPVEAMMTAWDIEPGKWEIILGIDYNDDEQADTILSKKVIELERSKGMLVNFAPHVTTVINLKLLSKSVAYFQRPDLGIDKDDIFVHGDTIRVKVHSLGSVDAPPAKLALMDSDKIIASVSVPSIQPPLELLPKCTDVTLIVPSNTNLRNCSILIDPDRRLNEITVMNNRIDLKEIECVMDKSNQMKSNDQNVARKKQPRPEHIAFNVKEPAAMTKWYCDYLGMMIVREGPPQANTYFIADSSRNMLLELYKNPDVPIPDYASLSHLSLHIAFMVDNLKAMRDSLIGAGATIVEDVTVIPTGDQILMLRDPWGLAIQFVKRVSPMLSPTGIRPEHFGLNVQDPQNMTNWYFENLGMKVLREGTPPTFTNFLADAGKNMMLEVFKNSAYPIIDMSKVNHLSLHFAFVVDDVRSIRTGLIETGATLVEDIQATEGGDEILMLRDPWGVPIQFIKRGESMLK